MRYFLPASTYPNRQLAFSFILLVIPFLPALFSCNQNNQRKNINVVAADSTKATNHQLQETEQSREMEKRQRIDSIYLDKVLQSALKIAIQKKGRDKFTEVYNETVPDSSNQVLVSVSSGFYFKKESPHLIVRRKTPASLYIDIFLRQDNQFKKVVSHEESDITYTSDTIQDINGDGLKDFVVNWYGSSGCCLKAFSDVYLLRPGNTFSNAFEFINPTFSPKEHVIRGLGYGHPGETEMYKYKWNGEQVDTVEYISIEKNDKGKNTGKIIVSSALPHSGEYKILKRLNKAPSEYRNVEGYDWFVGDSY